MKGYTRNSEWLPVSENEGKEEEQEFFKSALLQHSEPVAPLL